MILYKTDDLIKKIKCNDRLAIAYLYDKYGAAMYALLNKNETRSGGAEELLVSLFKSLPETISEFNPQRQRLFTWLLLQVRKYLVRRTASLDFALYNWVPLSVANELGSFYKLSFNKIRSLTGQAISC